MKYLQIDMITTEEGIEEISAALLNIGITDIAIEDPNDIDDILNKQHDYDWDYIDDAVLDIKNHQPKATVYLELNEENEKLAEEIRKAVKGLALSCEMSVNDDTEWKDKWKQYFKPTKVSDTIVVKPTWEEYEPQNDEKVLEIDPGMAFGTGTHETTSLCMKLMEKYMKKGDKVLDVGCGSGILSIAGALLGASDCLGVEIDPVAVEIAKENIVLNKVDKVARAQYGDLTKGIDYKANIVVANLMADLVMLLSKDVAKHILPGGYYISSGILVEKIPVVSKAIEESGFKIVEVKIDGMWSAIVATL